VPLDSYPAKSALLVPIPKSHILGTLVCDLGILGTTRETETHGAEAAGLGYSSASPVEQTNIDHAMEARQCELASAHRGRKSTFSRSILVPQVEFLPRAAIKEAPRSSRRAVW